VGTIQPNLGLDELFGVRERYVEFTPDLLHDLVFYLDGAPVRGALFLQAYEPTTGTAVGWYPDGRVAVVDHTWGEGKTRLVGTMCGAGYAAHVNDEPASFFSGALAYGDVQQHVRSSDRRITARLHDGSGGTYLWVANPAAQTVPVRLALSEAWGPYVGGDAHWGEIGAVEGRLVSLSVPGRNVTVLRLAS
jgi:beta-galactosidase